MLVFVCQQLCSGGVSARGALLEPQPSGDAVACLVGLGVRHPRGLGLLLDLLQGHAFVPELKPCWVCMGDCMTWQRLAAIVGFVMVLKHAALQVQVYLHVAYTLVGGQHNQWDWIMGILVAVVLLLFLVSTDMSPALPSHVGAFCSLAVLFWVLEETSNIMKL